MDYGLELSLGSDGISVECPQKENVTVYRCVKLLRIGACKAGERRLNGREIKYKLPMDLSYTPLYPDGDVYHAFEKSESRCRYCTGVSVSRDLMISSVFCSANRKHENK